MKGVESKPTQLGFKGKFSPTSPGQEVNPTLEILRKKNAWQELPPTGKQILSVTKMCMALGIKDPLEERVSNRREARDLMYELRGELRLTNSERKLRKSK